MYRRHGENPGHMKFSEPVECARMNLCPPPQVGWERRRSHRGVCDAPNQEMEMHYYYFQTGTCGNIMRRGFMSVGQACHTHTAICCVPGRFECGRLKFEPTDKMFRLLQLRSLVSSLSLSLSLPVCLPVCPSVCLGRAPRIFVQLHGVQ